MAPLCKTVILQGTKLMFLARNHLAPKFSKVVAKAKKLGPINKKIVEKTHYTVMSNGRVFLALKWSVCATKRDISHHNIQRNIWKIQDGGCWHVQFVAFVTILLNRPHRSCQFTYFEALFSCKKHQGKIYKTKRVLVANLATNFCILVASTIILVALVPRTGSSVDWASGCHAGGREFDSGRTNTQGLKITEEKVLPL